MRKANLPDAQFHARENKQADDLEEEELGEDRGKVEEMARGAPRSNNFEAVIDDEEETPDNGAANHRKASASESDEADEYWAKVEQEKAKLKAELEAEKRKTE